MRNAMMVLAVIPLSIACDGGGRNSSSANEQGIITFGETDRLAEFEATMGAERYAVEIDGVTIRTCANLFARIDDRADFSFAYGTKPFSAYTECFELPLLCQARAASDSIWRLEGLAEVIYRHLDLGTIGSSFGPRRPAESYRYTDFDLPAPKFGTDGFSIETEDWFHGVHPIAIADFDADGVADVLAWFVDQAKRASYFDVSPVILSRDTFSSEIRGQRVIQAVLAGTLETWPDDPMTCNRAE